MSCNNAENSKRTQNEVFLLKMSVNVKFFFVQLVIQFVDSLQLINPAPVGFLSSILSVYENVSHVHMALRVA